MDNQGLYFRRNIICANIKLVTPNSFSPHLGRVATHGIVAHREFTHELPIN